MSDVWGTKPVHEPCCWPTSSTFPVVRSFQQKWMRESSVCWMYTWPLRLSGVTVLPFMVILPARNSTRYLLEEPREPDTMLGNRAPEAIMKRSAPVRKAKLRKKKRSFNELLGSGSQGAAGVYPSCHREKVSSCQLIPGLELWTILVCNSSHMHVFGQWKKTQAGPEPSCCELKHVLCLKKQQHYFRSWVTTPGEPLACDGHHRRWAISVLIFWNESCQH